VNLYSLRNSAILDSGANIHVFNQLTRFQNFRAAPTGDYIATPDGEAPVLGYGEVDIEVRMRRAGRSDKVRVLRLPDVACCENFAVNLVSHRQLRRQGYWWDSHPDRDCIRQVRDNAVFCHLTDRLASTSLRYSLRTSTSQPSMPGETSSAPGPVAVLVVPLGEFGIFALAILGASAWRSSLIERQVLDWQPPRPGNAQIAPRPR